MQTNGTFLCVSVLVQMATLYTNLLMKFTGPDDTVAMSLANGLVGSGFASWYRLHPKAGF